MIQQIDLENRLIYYKDDFRYADKYRPMRDTKRPLTKILPLNYTTLQNLKNVNLFNGETLQLIESYKKRYDLMNSLKINALEKDKIRSKISTLNIPKELDWLYDYQKLDAYLGSQKKSFANFNAMRSGKTPTTCATLHLRAINNDPTKKVILSIIQATNWQWINEIKRTCPEYKVFDISISNKSNRVKIWKEFLEYNDYAILVSNKEKLKLDIEYTRNKTAKAAPILSKREIETLDFGLIVDECHFLRNDSQISNCVFFLSKHAQYRVGLTGTKISNRGEDLFGIFKFLHPKQYTNKWTFLNRYFEDDAFYIGNTQIHEFARFYEHNKTELMMNLWFDSIERTKNEVLPHLPNYQKPDPFLLEMDSEQTKYYKSMLNTFEFETIDGDLVSMAAPIAQRTKLLQIQSSPSEIVKDPKNIGVKVKWIVDYLKENRELKPIIFLRFTETTIPVLKRVLEEEGFKIGLITGKVKDKGSVQQAWQNGEYDVLICNIAAGGTGLTLDYADTIIYLDRDDNLANNKQAEERITATKKDDTRIKQILNLVINCDGSVDLIQYGRLNDKMHWVSEMHPDKITKQLIDFENSIEKQNVFIEKE